MFRQRHLVISAYFNRSFILSQSARYYEILYFFSFFLKFLLDTCLFVGPLIPCFGLLVTSLLGFKARVGSALFALGGGVRNICSLRFTSGRTPLPVYNASIAASRLPHMRVSVDLVLCTLQLQ